MSVSSLAVLLKQSHVVPLSLLPRPGNFPLDSIPALPTKHHVCYKTALEQEGSSHFLCTINLLSLISISGSGVFLDYKRLGESKDFLVALTV